MYSWLQFICRLSYIAVTLPMLISALVK